MAHHLVNISSKSLFSQTKKKKNKTQKHRFLAYRNRPKETSIHFWKWKLSFFIPQDSQTSFVPAAGGGKHCIGGPWSAPCCCLPRYLSLNCRKSTLCSQTNAVLNATAHLPAQLTSCPPYRKWWLSNSGRKCSVLVCRKVAALIESGEILGGKRKCLCHIQIFRVVQKTCSGQKQVATPVASEQARGVIFYFYFC